LEEGAKSEADAFCNIWELVSYYQSGNALCHEDSAVMCVRKRELYMEGADGVWSQM
jgi:hypothetical protein